MNQHQTFHPNLLSKDLEGATQTNTYTEKPFSYFDPTHQQVATHHADQRLYEINNIKNVSQGQKFLTKVKSMPLTIYNAQSQGYNSKSGENLEIKKNLNLKETENRTTKDARNAQFADFSPILNRVKSYELNRTFQSNLESKELIQHDFTIKQAPKVNNFDRSIQKGSMGYIEPITFQSSFQDRSKQIMSPTRQERPINFIQSQARSSQIVQNPVANVRINFNERNSQVQQSLYNKNTSIQPNNQGMRPSVVFQKPQNATFTSQQIIQSNISAPEKMMKFQSLIYDPMNERTVQSMNKKKDKISFAKLQQTPRIQEVEFQRPQFRKIYDNKEQCFRTVGPQEDYYKEKKSTCSKILPVLGVVIFLLLLIGTLIGLGFMMGLFGGKNYLAKNEGNLIEKEKQNRVTSEDTFVSNQIEDGQLTVTKQNEVENVEIVTPTVPIIDQKQKQEVSKQQETSVVNIQKNEEPKGTPQVDNSASTKIQAKTDQTVFTPTIIPQTVKPQQQKATETTTEQEEIIEPEVIFIAPQKVQQTKTQTIKDQVKPEQSSSIEPQTTSITIVQVTEEKPATQTQKSPEELTNQLFEPSKQYEITPSKTQIPQQTTQEIPVQSTKLPTTSPSEIDNKEKETVSTPEKQIITTSSPITIEQAGKIVDVIIEENHQIVPTNVKYSLKKDILSDFEQVPVNFRDVPHVEKISYQHLQTLVKSDPAHKSSNTINYRHHEVQRV